ncbi:MULTISPECIES: hypothetical protein [Lactococcus]|nr:MULTISPECIES: hypothetical protein [Lactococcus]MCR8687336.1 hypothetical protein [Lactococcus petauri]WKY24803.1 hypothetical protein P3G65_03045 [Lactococcus sp. bn62]
MKKLEDLWNNKLWFKILTIVIALVVSYLFGAFAVFIGILLFIYAIITLIRKYVLKKPTRFKVRYIFISFLTLTIIGSAGYAQMHPEELAKSRLEQQKAKKEADEKKAAEAKKAADEKKAAEAKKAADEKKAAEAKKAADEKKAAEAKKAADEKKAAEAKKAADEKKAAEAKKAADEKKAAEAKKAADEKKAAEAKKAADEKKAAEAKKANVQNAVQSSVDYINSSVAESVGVNDTVINDYSIQDSGAIYFDLNDMFMSGSISDTELKVMLNNINSRLISDTESAMDAQMFKYYVGGYSVQIAENRTIMNKYEVKLTK